MLKPKCCIAEESWQWKNNPTVIQAQSERPTTRSEERQYKCSRSSEGWGNRWQTRNTRLSSTKAHLLHNTGSEVQPCTVSITHHPPFPVSFTVTSARLLPKDQFFFWDETKKQHSAKIIWLVFKPCSIITLLSGCSSTDTIISTNNYSRIIHFNSIQKAI